MSPVAREALSADAGKKEKGASTSERQLREATISPPKGVTQDAQAHAMIKHAAGVSQWEATQDAAKEKRMKMLAQPTAKADTQPGCSAGSPGPPDLQAAGHADRVAMSFTKDSWSLACAEDEASLSTSRAVAPKSIDRKSLAEQTGDLAAGMRDEP